MANEARLAGQSVNAWPVIAGARYVIATLRQRVGDYARAEAELHALISSAQAQGDAAREADYYTALGELRLEQGQARGAIGLLLKAHDAYVALDDASAYVALNTAAYAYLEAGDAVSALATAEKAWVLCAPHATVLRAYIAHTKADALLALGRTGEAEHMLSLARRLAHESGPDPKLALYMQLTQAGILQAKGAFKDAIAMLCKVEASAAKAAFNMQVRLYQALISVHQVAGDSVAAAVCDTKLKALKIGRRNAQASDRNLLERLQERVNEMVGAWYQREAVHAASAAAK
jgi:tetratricopeptide (TPR) repeat protein